MNLLRLILVVVLVLLGAGAADVGGPVSVELGQLVRDPAAWRGKTVVLTLQVEGELDSWRPWVTRFRVGKYRGFSGWGDEQQLWREGDFLSAQRRLFVARGSAAERALAGAPVYRRFEVTAVVRSIFNGEAWIEILSAKTLNRSIGAGTLIHAGRALELASEGHDAAAREQYDRALAAPMPVHMRAAMEADRDRLKRDE